MVVLLSHKNADTHINVNVEFGEGDGKIPVGKIAEKAGTFTASKINILTDGVLEESVGIPCQADIL